MAINDHEREKISTFFHQKKKAGELMDLELETIDVLYPYTEWPCVLRLDIGDIVELYAAELSGDFSSAKAVLVGRQDKYGICHWEI